MPGATAPPIGGFPQAGWAPSKPSGLALWAIITTGAYTLTSLIAAATAQATIDETKRVIEEGATTAPTDPLQFVSFLAMLASFVLLAMWMMTIRNNLKQRGIIAGGPPAVEWWGWFVPIANYILPFLGMKAIARRMVSIGTLLGWWVPFCLTWIIGTAAAFMSFSMFDWTTGEVTNLDALDATVTLSYASGAAILVSWLFLVRIIRKVTDAHLTAS
ncbi:MAG: hypothetical protein CVT64_08875 [Actinobacteria bacterium HGW-Actinobacteria-4]|nr:MAG: hypothetical protein CVT64_08875 [Actinobacteria bacterium HGW-Actinobacteria-4]